MTAALDLPPEIWSMICREIAQQSKTDLSAVALACHMLYEIATPIYYETVEIDFRGDDSAWSYFRPLINPRNDGPCYIKEFILLTPPPSVVEDEFDTEEGDTERRSEMFDSLVSTVLKRVEQDALRKFEWNLPVETCNHVLSEITAYQRQIQKLSLYAPWSKLDLSTQRELRCLRIEQLDKVPALNALYQVLHTSSTLKHLKITLDYPAILDDYDGETGGFWEFFVTYNKEYPQSQELRYTKLGLTEFSLKGAEKCLDMTTVSSLSLSDCDGLSEFFTHMLEVDATSFNLRKLRLLLRRPNDNIHPRGSTVEAVHKFVLHISGLEELCLLTEISIERNLVIQMLQQHQLTLKTLVFDFFSSPGGFVPFELVGTEMKEMEFPQLKDFGVRVATHASDWGNLTPMETTLHGLPYFATRAKLRTLHVRGIKTHPTYLAPRCNTPREIAEMIARIIAATPLITSPEDITVKLIIVDEPVPDNDNSAPTHRLEKTVFYLQAIRDVLGGVAPVLTEVRMEKGLQLVGGKVGGVGWSWGEGSTIDQL